MKQWFPCFGPEDLWYYSQLTKVKVNSNSINGFEATLYQILANRAKIKRTSLFRSNALMNLRARCPIALNKTSPFISRSDRRDYKTISVSVSRLPDSRYSDLPTGPVKFHGLLLGGVFIKTWLTGVPATIFCLIKRHRDLAPPFCKITFTAPFAIYSVKRVHSCERG